ncbi:MAG: hypothetical protein ACK4N5_22210 [Myxococcales bacterium]
MQIASRRPASILPGGCVIPPAPAPAAARVSATSNDPAQRVAAQGAGGFRISGTASNHGFVPSRLTVTVDGRQLVVPLSRGMTPAQTAAALRKALPEGYELSVRATHRNPGSDVVVGIRRKPVAPARTPEVKVASNDPTQQLTSTGRNTFEVSGIASNNGFAPSVATVTVNGQTLRVPLNGGDTTEETARRIAAALPRGYTATFATKPPPPNVRVDPRAWRQVVTISRA